MTAFHQINHMLISLGGVFVHGWNVTPVGKPRMTRRDTWKKRPVVERYRAFKDILREEVGAATIERLNDPGRFFFWLFYHPFPKSYSKKKRASLAGQFMLQRPDTDNVIKAVWDTLIERDDQIGFVMAAQLWTPGEGRIELYELMGENP